MLIPTLDLLRNNYTAVGILEEFDDTLELFDRALGMMDLDWRKMFHMHGIQNSDYTYKRGKEELLAGPTPI